MPSQFLEAATAILHPLRFQIIRLLIKEKSASTTQIEEELHTDRRLLLFHLATLEKYGLVSSTLMSNPHAQSMGKISKFYKLTPRAKEVLSNMMKSLESLESAYKEDEIAKALSSEEKKQELIEKVKVQVHERFSPFKADQKILSIIKEMCWKIGIDLIKLEISKELVLRDYEPSSLPQEFTEITDFSGISKFDVLYVNGALNINSNKVEFVSRFHVKDGIEITDSQIISADFSPDEIENKDLKSKLSSYEEYVKLTSLVIASIINSYLSSLSEKN